MKFLGLGIERTEIDKESRRQVPLEEPRVVLRVATPAGSVRSIELDRKQLGKLLTDAAKAAEVLL